MTPSLMEARRWLTFTHSFGVVIILVAMAIGVVVNMVEFVVVVASFSSSSSLLLLLLFLSSLLRTFVNLGFDVDSGFGWDEERRRRSIQKRVRLTFHIRLLNAIRQLLQIQLRLNILQIDSRRVEKMTTLPPAEYVELGPFFKVEK